jgi:3-hydroxyisobutyrate dehydrogenase
MSLDSSQLVDALTGGYADSIPLQIFGRRMAQRNFEPKLGELSLMAKDLSLAATLADQYGSDLPIVTAAADFYEQACRGGFASADLGELIRLYAPQSAGDGDTP